jgi:uncharacterized protein
MCASVDPASVQASPLRFFALVLALSFPFWALGAMTRLQLLPGLSVTALMGFCPLVAAAMLVYRDRGIGGVFALLKRSWDFKRINAKGWFLPIFLLMPALTTLSIVCLHFNGTPLPSLQFPIQTGVAIFVAFFIGALGEELGWSGYVTDPMQSRWGALGASLLLGAVWAAWHVVPYMQAHRPVSWMGWYALSTVATRVVMVWIFNNTGKSVFGAAVFHAMLNLCWLLFPEEYLDPRFIGLAMSGVATCVVIVWGPQTLSKNRFA